MAEAMRPPQTSPRRLRDEPDFRRFWAARTVSLAGSALTYVALPVLIYTLTGSPLLTGIVAAFEAVPYLLFGLVAGALADRWDRRLVMVSTDLASAAVLGSIPVAAAFHGLTVPHILIAAAIAPTLFVFFDAANFGAVPMLVGRDRIAIANSAIWGIGSVVEIIVPATGGAMLAIVAPSSLISLDALSFVASAFLIRSVAAPLSETRHGRERLTTRGLAQDVREGLRFLVGHANLRSMTIVGACQSIAGGAFVGQLVVWANRRLGVREGNPRLGVLFAGWSLGVLIATLLMPRLVRVYGAARVTLLALPVSACLAVATAFSWNWIAGAIFIVAWGVAYMLVVTNGITYRQQVTPESLMSRVGTAGRMLSFGVGFPIGGLLGGLVAQGAGPIAGMLAGAAVAGVGTVIGWTSPLRTAPRNETQVTTE